MNLIVFFACLPAVFAAVDEFWITPCGHVYKKVYHPLRVVRNAQTLLRLKHHFKRAQELVTKNEKLQILENLNSDVTDPYVLPSSTLEMYNNVRDVRRLMELLPLTYRTLQDLAFALKVVHDELVDKEDEHLKKRHSAVTEIMDVNSLLLCELDLAMNRNNMEFFRIDQQTLSPGITMDHNDQTFTHMKHSLILTEYRTFIKHVTAHILRLV